MKATERAEELQEFLLANQESFLGLAKQFAGKPQEEFLQKAADDFEKYAASAGILLNALGDREAALLHVRNVAETALNTARLELSEGKNPEDCVEKARAAIARVLPYKKAQ